MPITLVPLAQFDKAVKQKILLSLKKKKKIVGHQSQHCKLHRIFAGNQFFCT